VAEKKEVVVVEEVVMICDVVMKHLVEDVVVDINLKK